MNRKQAAVGLTAAAAGAVWLAWGNTSITTTEYIVTSPAVPRSFDGLRIAQVSDLHNDSFGLDYIRLVRSLQAARPHFIAITGDMLDARRTNIPRALTAAQQMLRVAPCIYTKGNHEARIPAYPLFEEGLREAGVFVLRNDSVTIERNGEHLTILGMDCPYGDPDYPAFLYRLSREAKGFKLLLSHHPEQIDTYNDVGIDLALCGHTHGGQLRLPMIGGIIAPHQGFFPKYDAGRYRKGHTDMIISRGLGNSLFPLRVNNRPELVVVELRSIDN